MLNAPSLATRAPSAAPKEPSTPAEYQARAAEFTARADAGGWSVLPIAAPVIGMVGGALLAKANPKAAVAVVAGSVIAGAGSLMGSFAGIGAASLVKNRGGVHTEADAARAGMIAAGASAGVVALAAASMRSLAASHPLIGIATAVGTAATMAGTAYISASSTQLTDEAIVMRHKAEDVGRR